MLVLTNSLSAQDAGKGSNCVTSSIANKTIEQVINTSLEVSELSLDVAKEMFIEYPEAAVALAVVALATYEIAEIAKAFQGNQMGKPVPVNIPFSDLTASPMKWNGSDGDVIEVSKKPGSGKLVFSQENGNWWKGIVAFDKSNTNEWYEIMCVYDDHKAMQMNLTPNLGDTHFVTLSKAKFMGVHTNMYLINNWNEADISYDYFFNWVKD